MSASAPCFSTSPAPFRVDVHGIAFAEPALEHRERQRVEQAPLQRPLERPGAVDRIVPLIDQQIARAASESTSVSFRSASRRSQRLELDVDDLADVLAPERVEEDRRRRCGSGTPA